MTVKTWFTAVAVVQRHGLGLGKNCRGWQTVTVYTKRGPYLGRFEVNY